LSGAQGARVTVLLYRGPDEWRAGLRTLAAGVDVAAIAAQFGGGGHPRAAGCRIPGGEAERDAFLRAVDELAATQVAARPGAVGVWLTVKENIWNWPVGLANNAFFVVLFFGARLYADMGLQVVYIALGILGWSWWLHGGARRERLAVSTTPRTTWVVLGVLVALCTWGLTLFLRRIGDSAPLWDALTTTLSLAAQYLLTRKLLENWWVWIAADVIYIA